jgi:hypothetical protein
MIDCSSSERNVKWGSRRGCASRFCGVPGSAKQCRTHALLFPAGALPVIAIGPANDAGQHPFVAAVTDGTAARTGAYLLNPDGTLSPLLTSGATTDLGTITAVGTASAPPSNGVAINNRGQVAVPVKIGTGPGTLALLTPATP